MKRRPDGRFQKKITLPNGKQKTIYSSAANERLAVKDFNEQMLKLVQEEKDSLLFESVAEQWKDDCFLNLQNNTLKQYKQCYQAAVEFFSGKNIADIEAPEIKEYIDDLKRKGYAKKTVKNRLTVVSSIFNFAVLHGHVKYNPTTNIPIPKNLKTSKRETATSEEERIIINHAGENMISTLAYTFLVTGMRRGEAVALTSKDVDVENKIIHINKTAEWIGSKPQIKDCPKTESGIREIPVSDKLIELIRPMLKKKYIFGNDNGELLTNSQFTRLWDAYRHETGVNCTPHQLRHSFATLLFDADVDVKTAQKWLGHSDIKTTLDIYTHLSDSRLEKTTQKFQNYISSNY